MRIGTWLICACWWRKQSAELQDGPGTRPFPCKEHGRAWMRCACLRTPLEHMARQHETLRQTRPLGGDCLCTTCEHGHSTPSKPCC